MGLGRHKWLRDLSGSDVSAGFLSVVVSFGGPLLIYLNAAQSMGVGQDMFAAWLFAVLIAAGITSIGLSLWYRIPVAVAWSAPRTVLLISFGDQLAVSDMVGAYLSVALALILLAVTGVFQHLMTWVPVGV